MMTFLDSKPVNIRKWVYRENDGEWEFLHTFLSLDKAIGYIHDHGGRFGGGHYQVREVDKVIEDVVV